MAGKYLTLQDRKTIAKLYRQEARVLDIANKVGFHPATIYEELRRGDTGKLDERQRPEYDPVLAQKRVQEAIRRRGNHRGAATQKDGRQAGKYREDMLYVFSTCKHFIRTVPNLVYDEKNVEDIDTDGEDHIYDELRYVCMKNPISPRPRKAPPLVVYDPLDLQEQQQTYDRYDFYRRY